MRILRLDLRNGQGTVDLHPFMSIVQGLGGPQAEELVAAIRGLVRGSDVGLGGLIESGGELLELRGDGTDAIGPLTTEDVFVALDDVSGAGDPVVLQALFDQLEKRAMIEAAQLEEARADLDTGSAARVQRLHQSIAAFDGDDRSDLRRVEAVREAIDALALHQPILREMPGDIQEILGEWEEYEAARSASQPQIDAISEKIQQLMLDRESAQNAVTEAVALAIPVELTREEDARVEELSNPAVQSRRAKRSGSNDEDEMAELLARVGQTSYISYVMYRMAPQPAPETVAEVELAKLRLEQIEARLNEARADLEHGDVMQHLNGILEGVKTTARRHLGPMLPSDLGSALRKQVVERENPDWVEALRDLYDELVAQQVAVPDDLDAQTLPTWAAKWISETEAPIDLTSGPSRAELLGQLANAEKELERHARAMNRIDRLELVAATSADEAGDVAIRLASSDAPCGTSAERAVAMLRPLADRVRVQAGSSVPLILQGEFVDLEGDAIRDLLDELEVLAQDLQLVIVSNRAEAMEWASEVGLRRALCSSISGASLGSDTL